MVPASDSVVACVSRVALGAWRDALAAGGGAARTARPRSGSTGSSAISTCCSGRFIAARRRRRRGGDPAAAVDVESPHATARRPDARPDRPGRGSTQPDRAAAPADRADQRRRRCAPRRGRPTGRGAAGPAGSAAIGADPRRRAVRRRPAGGARCRGVPVGRCHPERRPGPAAGVTPPTCGTLESDLSTRRCRVRAPAAHRRQPSGRRPRGRPGRCAERYPTTSSTTRSAS